MNRPQRYGVRARRKDKWLRGWVLSPLSPEKAIQTFSKDKDKVEALCFLKTGKTPAQLGLEPKRAEIALRVYDKRPLLTIDHKLKN